MAALAGLARRLTALAMRIGRPRPTAAVPRNPAPNLRRSAKRAFFGFNGKMIRGIAYVRMATSGQSDGPSVPAQEARIRAVAALCEPPPQVRHAHRQRAIWQQGVDGRAAC